MPCPVCGKAVFENHSEVFCGDELCVYMTATVDLHNTLARRAEIGRLVESMAVNGCSVCLWESIDSQGPSRYTAEFRGDRDPIFQYGPTLLEALRALAAELEVSDE